MTAAHIELETGRTHQIRKHAARHRMPVVGDRRYGDQWGNAWPRLALHADQLHFTHPKTGVRHCIQSPIPDDLASLWALAGLLMSHYCNSRPLLSQEVHWAVSFAPST